MPSFEILADIVTRLFVFDLPKGSSMLRKYQPVFQKKAPDNIQLPSHCFSLHHLDNTVKPEYKNHYFSLSGWQRFLNYGHLTKYFDKYVGRGRGS